MMFCSLLKVIKIKIKKHCFYGKFQSIYIHTHAAYVLMCWSFLYVLPLLPPFSSLVLRTGVSRRLGEETERARERANEARRAGLSSRWHRLAPDTSVTLRRLRLPAPPRRRQAAIPATTPPLILINNVGRRRRRRHSPPTPPPAPLPAGWLAGIIDAVSGGSPARRKPFWQASSPALCRGLTRCDTCTMRP